MTIRAQVIADSISQEGVRLTSLQLRYPRFIHAELMTHRVFSRNASSSRAIPVEKLIDDIRRDTAMPMHWGKNQPGMQAKEENDRPVLLWNDEVISNYVKIDYEAVIPKHKPVQFYVDRTDAWMEARDRAIDIAVAFHQAGYHKQIVNRLLEPFSHINVLVTATEWDNFFELRDHEDAQPEIRELAVQMKMAMAASKPTELKTYEWHLPYVDEAELYKFDINTAVKVSAARCARVSYLTHDHKKPEIQKDVELFERLVGSKPIHASPTEHQAHPASYSPSRRDYVTWHKELFGNFNGWCQHRKYLEKQMGVR